MIVKPIACSIKGKAKFECRDGIILVDDRYQVSKCVGSGAYGHVFAAHDKVTNKSVAIKRIHKAFEDVIDAKRVLREIKILSKFSSFLTHFYFQNFLIMKTSSNYLIFKDRQHQLAIKMYIS